MPFEFRKVLLTQDGRTSAIVIPNGYDHSLSTYAEMAAIVKRTFPEVDDAGIRCGTITKSFFNQGMPFVIASVTPNRKSSKWETQTGEMIALGIRAIAGG